MGLRLVDILTDEVILRSVGSAAFHRGSQYASAGAVSELTVNERDRVLVASVHGSAPQPYQTLVSFRGSAPVDAHFVVRGVCTCPVAIACKHVAAAMFAARAAATPEQQALAARAGWEQSLAGVVQAEAERQRLEQEPIGLQFELVTPDHRSHQHYPSGPPRSGTPQPPRVRIRPVVPGRKGWVRSGVTWRDLPYDMWKPRVRAHRQVLQELFAAHQSSRRHYYGSAGDQPVYLDEFGDSLWPLLARAVQAGVEFVSSKGTAGPVTLSPAPATATLDLRQDSAAGPAQLTSVIRLGSTDLPLDAVQFLGHPAHGLLLDRSRRPTGDEGGLLLAPLTEPLGEAALRLIAAQRTIEIPAGDVARFLTDYYPRLRLSIAVVSSDESLQLPEIQPPRLCLTVTHLPDHQVSLDWDFGYPIGDETRHVSLEDSTALAGLRDLGAERRLLERLRLPDDRLPMLRAGSAGSAGSRRLVASVRLAGLDAVFFATELLPSLLARDDVEVEVVGTPVGYRRTESAPLVRVSATETSDSADWFDLAVAVSVDGEEVPFQDLFAALALGESHLILESGTFFSIERPEYDELRRLIDEARSLQDRESQGLRVSTLPGRALGRPDEAGRRRCAERAVGPHREGAARPRRGPAARPARGSRSRELGPTSVPATAGSRSSRTTASAGSSPTTWASARRSRRWP